jgi:hypothetical protein
MPSRSSFFRASLPAGPASSPDPAFRIQRRLTRVDGRTAAMHRLPLKTAAAGCFCQIPVYPFTAAWMEQS